MPPIGFGPQLLTQDLRTAQMGDIRDLGGLPLVFPLQRFLVKGGLLDDVENAPSFELFPAFAQDVQHRSVHRRPHAFTALGLSRNDLVARGQMIDLFSLARLGLFERPSPLLTFSPPRTP